MSSTHRLTRGSVRRALALSAAGAMVFALTPAQSAFATHGADDARDIQEAGDVCENADGEAFEDITNNDTDVAADCLNDLNIARGYGDNEYRPGQLVNREQMASFISRKLDAAVDYERPDNAPEANFTDREQIAQVHINNVDILASLDIVEGFEDGSYRPGAAVTRGQMASFIVREMETITGQELTATEDHFDDDDNTTHEDNINVLAEHGIAEGTGDGFEPHAPVTRGQMALFIARNVDALNNEFGVEFERVVDESEIFIATRTVQPGDEITGVIGGNPTDVAVNGCGLTDEALTDDNATAEDFQFSFLIPASQEAGDCTLVFTFTDEAGDDQTVNVAITVEAAPGNQTVTERPELFSADIVRTVTTTQATPSDPAGTTVRYTFDEDISNAAPTAGEFMVYEFDGDVHFGNAATLESATTNSVLVRFDAVDTAAEAGELSVATVDPGAVRDNDGNTNPEGDDAIGAGRTTAIAAGTTDAPDLTNVSGFRQSATPGVTAVDFTFDEAAFVQDPAGYHLVLTDGTDVVCAGPTEDSTTASGGTVPGGEGTATHTVLCDQGDTTLITAAEVARGYVEAGTVGDTDAGGNTNPLQAHDVSGTSAEPDLVEARLILSDTTDDQILYTFDEFVSTATATSFQAYVTGTAEFQGDFAQLSPTNERQVLVTFAEELEAVVGASVLENAVREPNNGPFNEEDEVAVANQQSTSTPAGRTDGPDLTAVALNSSTDTFGRATVTATYTFDEDILDGSATAGDFFLYQADGTRLVCTSVTEFTAEDADNTVRCNSYVVDANNNGLADAGELQASAQTVGSAVLGTVQDGAVIDETGTDTNPEGAEVASGSTGTPRN